MPTATSTTTRNRGRASSNARTEILEMLKDDHKKAKKAFRDFERLDPDEDAEECARLVQQTCADLTVHATLEEELLYPAAREALADEDLVDEAEVEHMSAKQLIEQLKGMEPGEEKYGAFFTVLGEYIKHHVKEEEGEMFPQLERAKLDWQSLHEEMLARRQALMAEMGVAPADGDGEVVAAASEDDEDAEVQADEEASVDEDAPPTASRSRSTGSGRSTRTTARKSTS